VPSGAIAASFTFGHPQRINDYGYRAVHRTALDAEAIVTAFYGTPPQHDYFDGCSEGGGEGLSEAQRYPDDFNGIMVGHPVSDSFLAAILWNAQHVANPNNPAGFIPSGLLPTITNAVQNACVTARTVPSDNFLGNPTQCNFDPQWLAPALGPGQIASLAAIYNGPATSAGVSVGPGYEPGNEAQLWPYLAGQLTQVLPGTITEATLTTPPTTDDFLDGTFVLEAFLLQAAPPNFNALTYFDVDTTPAQVFAVPIVPPSPDSAVQTVGSAVNNHSNPNLAPFRARGGKLIHYHGWADPLVQPLYSVNYYNSVVALAQQSRRDYQSALAETQSYYRLFMVPGMGHCTLGPGPVLFGANGGAGPASSDMFSAWKHGSNRARRRRRSSATTR